MSIYRTEGSNVCGQCYTVLCTVDVHVRYGWCSCHGSGPRRVSTFFPSSRVPAVPWSCPDFTCQPITPCCWCFQSSKMVVTWFWPLVLKWVSAREEHTSGSLYRRCMRRKYLVFHVLFSGAFTKLRKGTTDFVDSVRPFACNKLAPTGQTLYFSIFPKSLGEIRVSWRSNNNNRYFTWRPTYTFYNISPKYS